VAEHLGVSRSVVLEAYDQLLAEGFVVGRSGSGTYVSRVLSSNRLALPRKATTLQLSRFGSAAANAAATLDGSLPSPRYRYDFKFGRSESDIETFPFEYWQRILTRRSRAVVCDPSDMIIVNGSQQALELIARVPLEPGDRDRKSTQRPADRLLVSSGQP
jgi:GntR family transcriptional regulator/MocR family aminotransferase